MISFRAQIAIVVLASIALLSLAGVLIRDVISMTETRLAGEAEQQVIAACRELKLQFEDRSAFVTDDPLNQLPFEAQDVSLRGLAGAVLRSYRDMEGGFFLGSSHRAVGFTGARELSGDEESLLARAAGSSGDEASTATAEWGVDLAVAAAIPLSGEEGVAWTLKVLPGARDPVVERRRWLLAGLLFSAILGLGGLVSVWSSLRSGVAEVKNGLAEMESDLGYRMPEVRGDFGQIAEAINQMSSRRMALETELRRQERLAALGKAVAGVAHEIRNPLNSMKLTLELLRRRLGKGTAEPKEVSAAIGEIDRLDQIVARLLAFGRPSPGESHRQSISPLIGQAIRMVREQSARKDVGIEADYPDGDKLAADVDGAQIQQVLLNLLLNAIEASPPGETVAVEARRRGDRMRIAVTDHGPGISPEAQPHIFDVYYTTKEDGVGLGLSISREIIRSHGGKIEFESSAGGATFVIELPLERLAS